MTMLIDLVVYDGVDEMDVVGPLEVFRSAATAGAEVAARGAWPDLEATDVTLVRERVVDGELITCGGVTSEIDLALWLLEREVSVALAELVADRMQYSRVRPSTALRAQRDEHASRQSNAASDREEPAPSLEDDDIRPEDGIERRTDVRRDVGHE